MELRNRVLRVLHCGELGILVTDVAGELHLLDEDLNLISCSPPLPGGQPLRPVFSSDIGRDSADRQVEMMMEFKILPSRPDLSRFFA